MGILLCFQNTELVLPLLEGILDEYFESEGSIFVPKNGRVYEKDPLCTFGYNNDNASFNFLYAKQPDILC